MAYSNRTSGVDGLKTSQYLINTAIKNIEGEISIDEAQSLLNSYYEENPNNDSRDRTEEANKVAARIANYFQKKLFHLPQTNIFQSIKNFLLGFIVMQEKLETITSQKRNGFWMVWQ